MESLKNLTWLIALSLRRKQFVHEQDFCNADTLKLKYWSKIMVT